MCLCATETTPMTKESMVMKKCVVTGYWQVLNGKYQCKDDQIGRDYLWITGLVRLCC